VDDVQRVVAEVRRVRALERVVDPVLGVVRVVALVDERELDDSAVNARTQAVRPRKVGHPGDAALERTIDRTRAARSGMVLGTRACSCRRSCSRAANERSQPGHHCYCQSSSLTSM
jgi:hypothetical protein